MQLNKGSPVVVYTPAILQYDAELSTEDIIELLSKLRVLLIGLVGDRQLFLQPTFTTPGCFLLENRQVGNFLLDFQQALRRPISKYFWILLKS